MPEPVTIISALLPPLRGGLADHTFHLANLLRETHAVSVISSDNVNHTAPFEVRAVISDWLDIDHLEREIAQTPKNATLLWQYVPHMYGHGGVNLQLPKLWAKFQANRRRQLFIAHEIAAGWSLRPHWSWYTAHHYWQWLKLSACADEVAIATEVWLQTWSRRMPSRKSKFFLCPSPTSVSPQPVAQDHRKSWRKCHQLPQDCQILVYFGTLNASKQLGWVIEGWKRAHSETKPVAFCLAGGAPELNIPESLRRLYRPLGFLKNTAVSEVLQAADLLALPFFDGVSERRSSLMTGLAHGIPVVSTWGHNTGPTLRIADFIYLTPPHQSELFAESIGQVLQDSRLLERLSLRGRHAYEAQYSWEKVMIRIRNALARMAENPRVS